MVRRNLTIPHEFVCLTEHDFDPGARKGWWLKLDLVAKSYGGWVLYFDLDVTLTANIDRLVRVAQSDASRLWMRDDFSYSIVKPRQGLDPETRKLLGGPGCCNSSVMIFHDTVDTSGITERMRREMHGDQNCLTAALWPDRIGLLPPDMIQSYKYGIRMQAQQPAPIVVMHGTPKCHEISDSWAKEHWQ